MNNIETRTKNISLTIDSSIYSELKNYVPQGKLSSLTNKLFKEYLEGKKKEKLVTSYQRIAKSKSRQETHQFTEGAIQDGIK
ncbi:MAG: hypothetical protein mread185_000477 [Mycoplasmataceae bacterium]|nr:MAG: hypothetical protein mread185_000477 [Mycoplasmataceae bacterium]